MFPFPSFSTAVANGMVMPQSMYRGMNRMPPSPMKTIRPPQTVAADANSMRGLAQQAAQENRTAGVADPAAAAYQQYKAGFVNAAAIPQQQAAAQAPQASAPMPGGAAPADPTMGPASTMLSAPPSAPQPAAAQPSQAPVPQAAPPQQPGMATPLPGGMAPMSPAQPQQPPYGQMDLPTGGTEQAMGLPTAGSQGQLSQMAGDAQMADGPGTEMKFNKMVEAFAKHANANSGIEKFALSPSNFVIPAMAAGTHLARKFLGRRKRKDEPKEKKAWQVNTSGPRTSAVGEGHNMGFAHRQDDYAKGPTAFKSMGKYLHRPQDHGAKPPTARKFAAHKKASIDVARRVLDRVQKRKHSLEAGHKPFFAVAMPDPDSKPENARPAITGLH